MSVDAAQLPPQPRPDPDSEGFWSATASGRIELCRCRDCGLWHHPPLERCRACAAETRFDPIAGTGSLRSFIVVRHAAVPGYLDAVPYIVGMVELDEQPGLRLVGLSRPPRQLTHSDLEIPSGFGRYAARLTSMPRLSARFSAGVIQSSASCGRTSL